MQEYLDQIQLFIQTNQVWAGPIIGLLTFGESLLIVGVLIPATTLLFFAGGLVGSGTLEPMPLLVWGSLGAILGDAASYALGRWTGPSLLRWKILKRHRTSVARARLFFYRYGFMAVFVGRFLGPLRSTVPAVAGVMGMSHWRFQIANITSSIAWVPALLAPGFLTAKSLSTAQQTSELGLYIAGGLSLVIGVGLFYLFVRKRPSKR
ncbi:DedA family protein [Orrella marina]|uniref:VTT domain-containing protein n=1 Tax=Orrella marina TaxID=2163011 RepID=A0A2R4XHS9_9BURK|nr:DedA family protein [Orrella marina]AWB33350.1 hypothetical protein DBV39_06115 [Orrella marina]